ncbi:winged helix-turn-helix transcriptional regulator [Candidatus Woesearchaeota archaeon]|nr:winged helix-turn-helix transcriptional regulator [Candidatus Woesearchaeota archaeon]
MKDKCYMFFETLGTRLKMEIIFKIKEKQMNVNDLSNSLNQERSKVSHALKTLLDCGIVRVKKKNKQRIYSLNNETIIPLFNIIEEHIRKYCKTCKKGAKNG